MPIPAEYHGREQSWLKHRILTEYLRAWAHKLSSQARCLWYVDAFAGPWQSKNVDLRDTSIDIGLRALEEAAKTWRDLDGRDIELGAVFVEKDPGAYRRLREYLDAREGVVRTHPFHGEFGAHVTSIQQLVQDDPAFVFVDPTGFKGVEMRFIAPLVEPRFRDVLINVMFNDVNRWKDDPRTFLREQMRAFFGVDDLPGGLEEPDLLRTYRTQLKNRSTIRWAADIAVPHPTINRTWFRLVVGGKHPEVLRVFRDAERKIIGGEAEIVRTEAANRQSPQTSLFPADQLATGADRRYAAQHSDDLDRFMPMVREVLGAGSRRWQELWPALLEELHLPLSELNKLCFAAGAAGELRVSPTPSGRRRTLKDTDLISLG